MGIWLFRLHGFKWTTDGLSGCRGAYGFDDKNEKKKNEYRVTTMHIRPHKIAPHPDFQRIRDRKGSNGNHALFMIPNAWLSGLKGHVSRRREENIPERLTWHDIPIVRRNVFFYLLPSEKHQIKNQKVLNLYIYFFVVALLLSSWQPKKVISSGIVNFLQHLQIIASTQVAPIVMGCQRLGCNVLK